MSPYSSKKEAKLSGKCHSITDCWCHSWLNAADARHPKVTDLRHPLWFVNVTVSRLFTQSTVNLKLSVSNTSRGCSAPSCLGQIHRFTGTQQPPLMNHHANRHKKATHKKVSVTKQVADHEWWRKLFTLMGNWVSRPQLNLTSMPLLIF